VDIFSESYDFFWKLISIAFKGISIRSLHRFAMNIHSYGYSRLQLFTRGYPQLKIFINAAAF